jgi:DNA repair protein RadC
MTRKIVAIAAPFGITVHDHIIVGRNGHTRFRALRLIGRGVVRYASVASR